MVRAFIEGPAGVGKTEYGIQHIRELLDAGANPEQVLVLVPHRALGRPYTLAAASAGWPGGAEIEVVTFGGLVRRALEVFWPLVAAQDDHLDVQEEPVFLTIETSQFFMAGFVSDAVDLGVFDAVSITPQNIMRQTLDNLAKAAVNGIPLEQVANRLIAAWGTRHSSRPPVYRASVEVAQRFRAHCKEYNLLDFSLQVELFMKHLLDEQLYHEYFQKRYRHLVADNLEENFPVTAQFIEWALPGFESALLLYDSDGGYRIFLGASPIRMQALAEKCDETQRWNSVVHTPPVMVALADIIGAQLGGSVSPSHDANIQSAFTYASHKFYPQMIDWTASQIGDLIDNGVPPGEIAVLAPFLGDSLRFALTARLSDRGIPAVSHRPSRAVRDEPAARAVLTWLALAYPEWRYRAPVTDVADALQQSIGDLDPVRAWLLAQIVYRPGRGELGPFENIKSDVQERVTFRAGNKYDALRQWLVTYREGDPIPPDHFFSRLFGEVLSQPGYGFHTHLDAGRVVAELVESARKFRQALYPTGAADWNAVTRDYYTLVQKGLLAALHVPSWRVEEENAVFLAPAYTFLMRNRWVDHQFWLDVGSNLWWERLEQPLTHPYVLVYDYPPDQVWTDEMEFETRKEALRRLMVGLTRRCRKHVYAAISDLGEQGYEQRGPLLRVFQYLIQHYGQPEGMQP